MSAVPEDFMRPDPGARQEPPTKVRDRGATDTPMQTFWQWFALVSLLFGWLAEATMCAERGF